MWHGTFHFLKRDLALYFVKQVRPQWGGLLPAEDAQSSVYRAVLYVCVCVCVCVCGEREKTERNKDKERARETDRLRQRKRQRETETFALHESLLIYFHPWSKKPFHIFLDPVDSCSVHLLNN